MVLTNFYQFWSINPQQITLLKFILIKIINALKQYYFLVQIYI